VRTTGSQLLKQLGSGVIPIDIPTSVSRGGTIPFIIALDEAQQGRLRSGLPVTNAPGASFEPHELALFAQVADAAEAAGVQNVAVVFGNSLARVNIEHRHAQDVPAVLDHSIAPSDVLTQIDGLVKVLIEEQDQNSPAETGNIGQHAAHGRALSVLNHHPAVAELLAGGETHRKPTTV
jgi:hypothetical protein